MTPIELWDVNAQFHEKLAAWSHNRFLLQRVRRLNQLRRLVECRLASTGEREQRQAQTTEHLAILSAIELGDYVHAAALLRQHLDGARQKKVNAIVFGN